MIYSEASYPTRGGPPAHHFQHIADRIEMMERVRKLEHHRAIRNGIRVYQGENA